MGDNLGDVAAVPVLVVVLAAANRALDEDLPSLLEVLPTRLRLLAEDDDIVPLGLLLPLAIAVGVDLAGRYRKACDRLPARCEPDLRIFPEISDQQHFVERHVGTPLVVEDGTIVGGSPAVNAIAAGCRSEVAAARRSLMGP